MTDDPWRHEVWSALPCAGCGKMVTTLAIATRAWCDNCAPVDNKPIGALCHEEPQTVYVLADGAGDDVREFIASRRAESPEFDAAYRRTRATTAHRKRQEACRQWAVVFVTALACAALIRALRALLRKGDG